jgi:membrane-associated phospholipid phosphatase
MSIRRYLKAPVTFKRSLLERRTVWQVLVAFAFYVLPVIIFVRLALEVQERTPPALDAAILHWLRQPASPGLDSWAVWLTDLGGPIGVTVVTLVGAIALYLGRRRRAALVLVTGVGGAAVINSLLKLIFQRARPDLWEPLIHEASFSFPSGHAMVSSALACSVVYILWRTRWRWWAIGLGLIYALVIGLTRLYLGVHYPTDVLAGWLVGFTWVAILRAALWRSRRWRAKGVSEMSEVAARSGNAVE